MPVSTSSPSRSATEGTHSAGNSYASTPVPVHYPLSGTRCRAASDRCAGAPSRSDAPSQVVPVANITVTATRVDSPTVTDARQKSPNASAKQAADSTAETYSITQLAHEFDISPRTIRFYEDKGLLNPDRSRYRRAYSKRDRVRLILILRGKRVGFSLDETRALFDIYDSGTGKENQLRHWFKLLTEHEERLLQNKRDIEELLEEIDSAKAQCLQNLDKITAP